MNQQRTTKIIRYKENPFLEDMEISTRNRQVRVRALGRDGDVSIINHKTGELTGTQMISYKTVDNDKFVKLFAQNIALTFNFTSAGNKALVVLIWMVQYNAIEKDYIALDSFSHQDFLDSHKEKNLKLSMATFKRGLREMEGAKIIAKAERAGFYFINPAFVFNGDRIAFTNVIERKKAESEQLNLIPEGEK